MVSKIPPNKTEHPWLVDCSGHSMSKAAALTVAGQWRNFTAFPSILAIAIMDRAAPSRSCRNYKKLMSMTSCL